MFDSPSPAQLDEAQQHFGLPFPALVEKDWYVVKALAAINNAGTAPFRLIFGGGTALCRAHRLIRRMSEDIDFRIVCHVPYARSGLRRLRATVNGALLDAGFVFDPENPAECESRNVSRYIVYRLPYPSVTEVPGSLYPAIKIELAVWPLRLPAVSLPVISFLAEAANQPPEVPAIPCVSLVENTAEKFVAFTRRAGAEIANAGGPRDAALVRHFYDLHALRAHSDPDAVVLMARTIMLSDAAAYGNQFPEYRENPVRETIRAGAGMAEDSTFATRYADLLRDMVYGERQEFSAAYATIADLAGRLS